MPPSPYDLSRQTGPPVRLNALPSLAVICNIPTPEEYADADPPGMVPLILVVAFEPMFDRGVFRDELKTVPGYAAVPGRRVNREIYVNFGEYKILDYVQKVGKGYVMDAAKFIATVIEKYEAYSAPKEYDYCRSDPTLAWSQMFVNVLSTQIYVMKPPDQTSGPQPKKKKKSDPPPPVDTLKTAYAAMWRQFAASTQWFEGMVLRQRPVQLCYQTDRHLFEPQWLDPPAATVSNEIYHSQCKDEILGRIMILNGVLNIIGNFGTVADLASSYRTRLGKVKMQVGGHTDQRASLAHNETLSLNRAKGIVAFAKLKESVAAVLKHPRLGASIPDAYTKRLSAKGYAYSECDAGEGVESRACRKISVRLAYE